MAVGDLPEFPWDSLLSFRERAAAHSGGLVDLSVGRPIDPTPARLQAALAAHADAPGYPTAAGTAECRAAVVDWFARVRGVPGLDPAGVMPTVGSKELVAALPGLLGIGPGDLVVHPRVAYPTYDVGARLVGARPVPADSTVQLGPVTDRVRLIWLNTPANPTGRVHGVAHLAKVVSWAREHTAVVASDECYCDLGWDVDEVPSILDPRVTGGDVTGLLAVCSASKRSNLAGYRAAFVAGDPALVQQLVQVRRHTGLLVPAPVQAALAASLTDDSHVREQVARYRSRRERLLAAVDRVGLRVDDSEGGLYLWATGGRDCWETVKQLAELGVLVAPGTFYGPAGAEHIRISLTATDERIDAAVARLAGSGGLG